MCYSMCWVLSCAMTYPHRPNQLSVKGCRSWDHSEPAGMEHTCMCRVMSEVEQK